MSLRLEMLRIAKLALTQLRDANELVCGYLRGQLNEDGGFKDRAGSSDLYYTVFGVEGAQALRAELPTDRIVDYVKSFGAGKDLDLVHLSCLARCDASLSNAALSPGARKAMLDRLARFRTDSGGYANDPGRQTATVYGCFLALGAYQDLGAAFPHPEATREFLRRMETPDGAYSNEPSMQAGSTAATAAAIGFLRSFDYAARESAGDWLLDRAHHKGGFFAAPGAPVPDLLSTATALHALAALQVDLGGVREACVDFLDSLWTSRGSFLAHWAETEIDVEYTFYGLLALGHLGA